MIEWEPNKNDANLNIPVDGQVASICWNEQTKLLTMFMEWVNGIMDSTRMTAS